MACLGMSLGRLGLKRHSGDFRGLLHMLAALCIDRHGLEKMEDKENQLPGTQGPPKVKSQKDLDAKTPANPREWYMNTESDNENMLPPSLQCLEEPERCHNMEDPFYIEKLSETSVCNHL